MKARVFTKERPCNKVDIWNCFRSGRRFTSVPVLEAKQCIGEHVPNHLVRAGRAEIVESRGADVIRLTPEGAEFLKEGTERYIRNQIKAGNVEILDEVSNPLSSWKKLAN